MKQTAVEWLIEQLVKMDKQLDGRRKNEDATIMKMNPTKILEQAKEMEKQQIMESYKDSTCQFSVDSRIDCPKSAEQYYNETFKNK
jgi:hypothetical protein